MTPIDSYQSLVEQTMVRLRSARRNVFIAGGDLSWVGEFYPILTLKAIEGVSIRILSAKRVDTVLAAALGGIGCELRQSAADLVSYGTFFDASEPDGTAILVELRDAKLRGGSFINKQRRPGVLSALIDRLEVLWREAVPQNACAQPKIESVEWQVVEEALRAHVMQYRNSVLLLQPVAVNDVFPLTDRPGIVSLRRAEAIMELYKRTGRTPFLPMRIRGSGWFLAPPVVEIVKGRLALVDGRHRLHYCRNQGVATVTAILVHTASEWQAAEIRQDWSRLRPLAHHIRQDKSHKQYEESRWRDIQSAWAAIAHQSLPALPSAQAFRYPSTLPQS